ncbi:MAG: YkgJ family cysteine cluster protein [Alphaproteobacteria bacterium]|nr:YkgJ family cysteine cluster protein [Alphaproteobacteria bacterium]
MHPCLSCGACCAAYRVSFYWAESRAGGGSVPDGLVEQVGPWRAAMQGTSQAAPRCAALLGTVGESVRCSIYEDRPSPCHELKASWEDGLPDDKCDRARQRHGLAPLTQQDWGRPEGPVGPVGPARRTA